MLNTSDYQVSQSKTSIFSKSEEFTPVEKSIGDFFLSNTDIMDFSSKSMARLLYVSEPTLSRFAKKCGYKGYRDFIYQYERDLVKENQSAGAGEDQNLVKNKVLSSYNSLLAESLSSIGDDFLKTIKTCFKEKRRMFICCDEELVYGARLLCSRINSLGFDADLVAPVDEIKNRLHTASEKLLIIVLTESLSEELLPVFEEIAQKQSKIVIQENNMGSLLNHASVMMIMDVIGEVAACVRGSNVSNSKTQGNK